MTNKEIYAHVDHTQLKAFATWQDIEKLCDEAVEFGTASVCVPPCYIKRISDKYGEKVNICTVIGFPLGYSVTASKIVEAKEAIKDGANEVDMVINISDVKNGDFDKVEKEIAAIKEACGDKILKVIIETCYLTDDEKIKLCRCVTNAKADYIKTSTGFGTAGATFEDVALFAANVGDGVLIKAAGGIRTREDCLKFLELGADRLGTSSAITILEGK